MTETSSRSMKSWKVKGRKPALQANASLETRTLDFSKPCVSGELVVSTAVPPQTPVSWQARFRSGRGKLCGGTCVARQKLLDRQEHPEFLQAPIYKSPEDSWGLLPPPGGAESPLYWDLWGPLEVLGALLYGLGPPGGRKKPR